MDKRKEEIVQVAIKRFSHYGFTKTTMNEIAEDLGVTKANLYYYYPDKPSLIKDVICFISNILFKKEEALIAKYDGDFLGTLFAVLELRAEHMREYYILYINENIEWIKGVLLEKFIQEIKHRDFLVLRSLVSKAVEDGTLDLIDVDGACHTYVEIVQGLNFLHTAPDVLHGIPNKDNVDKVLLSQKNATQLIFERRLVTI